MKLAPIWYGFFFALGFSIAYDFLNTVYLSGYLQGRANTIALNSKRKGNVIEYPFKKKEKETPEDGGETNDNVKPA